MPGFIQSRGICPTGWHVPSDAEWIVLSDFLGGEGVAGGKMKITGTTLWSTPNTGATNQSGFSGLPGGYRQNTAGLFEQLSQSGHWWSTSEVSGSIAWFRFVSYDSEAMGKGLGSWKINAFSVRCLKD